MPSRTGFQPDSCKINAKICPPAARGPAGGQILALIRWESGWKPVREGTCQAKALKTRVFGPLGWCIILSCTWIKKVGTKHPASSIGFRKSGLNIHGFPVREVEATRTVLGSATHRAAFRPKRTGLRCQASPVSPASTKLTEKPAPAPSKMVTVSAPSVPPLFPEDPSSEF